MALSVPDFSASRILVAGDVMLDRYWLGPTHRISPEAPVPVVSVDQVEDRAGGAANVSVNLAALGVQSALCGVIGVDAEATVLSKLLSAAGVRSYLTQEPGTRTISKLRVMSRNQQLIRLDTETHLSEMANTSILAEFSEALDSCDVVVFSDYAKGALSSIQALIGAARKAGKKILIDPKGTDFTRYRGADLLTPNMGEFEKVVGQCADDEQLAMRGKNLCKELQLGALLVTRSERGMSLIQPNGTLHFAAKAHEVFDVTGAGDTVIATLAACISAGMSLKEAVALSNLAASIAVSKLGVATVTRTELRQALHGQGIGGRGLLSDAQLIDSVNEAKSRGETLVFTNGCFDILHAGHVAYLEEAKACGSRLIVAVNDDDSVRRLKGASRPVNTLEDRLSVLAGLAAVDWVTSFADDTPLALIEALTPDVLVKGGDYQADTIVGANWVREHGGEVKVLTFKSGRSTTQLIDAIRKA